MAAENNHLKLNVGGTVFETSRATLTRQDTRFREILEDGKDKTDIFIDRDPHHFRLILNFLRDGSVQLPVENHKKLHEILAEATYYRIQELVELCQKLLGRDKKGYHLIKETAELFDVLMEAKKDVLVFKVPSDNEATIIFPYNRTDFDQFVEKYKDRCQVVLYLSKTLSSYEWQVEHYPIDKEPQRPGAEGFPDFYEEYDRAQHRY